MRPDFTKVSYTNKRKENTTNNRTVNSDTWTTAEQIPLKSVYTKEDIENLEHLDYAAGIPPF